MLFDLSFLATGEPWPPPPEARRLKTYRDNRLLFEGEHGIVYQEQLKRIERVLGGSDRPISFATVFNYQRLITLKMADLVFGEPPTITVADKTGTHGGKKVDDKPQRIIDQILQETGILDAAYAAALDVSRYGDGLLVLSNQDGKPRVDVTTPAIWFPVVDKSNIKKIQYHVLAYQYLADWERKEWRLKVQIHSPDDPGQCEEHTYQLIGAPPAFSIGEEIRKKKQTDKIETQLGACPIFRIPNTLTSDRIYGMDDYDPIDSIVSELIIRVSQISNVLDKHAAPSMSGPSTALDQDGLGNYTGVRAGNYFIHEDAADPEPKYLTWDGNLESAFQQVDLLLNQLYTISEMGSAIFGDLKNSTGQVPSGTAMRRLMMSPLAKARRIANAFDPAIKQIISLCAGIYGTTIAPEDISISWNDGLPDDEAEMAEIMATRTGSRPTISQYSAIRRMDKLSAEDAQSELDNIRQDDAADGMGTLPAEDEHADEDLPEDEDEE